MRVEENGLVLNLSDETSFQIESNAFYNRIKSLGIKEMDACWYDAEKKVLYCIELKGFYNPENELFQEPLLTSRSVYDEKIDQLIKKSIDTIELLHNSLIAQSNIIPFPVAGETIVYIIHLLRVDQSKLPTDFFINATNLLRQRIRSQLLIFGIPDENVMVLDYDKACKLFYWVGDEN